MGAEVGRRASAPPRGGMTTATSLPQLYRRPINVWVEDAITRAYLGELWRDDDIGFHVAGGAGGVATMTTLSRRDGIRAIYGVADRDFGATNRARWGAGGKIVRVFRLSAFEIENYLIDPPALHAAGQLGVADPPGADVIEAALRERAAELCWWAACGAVVADLDRAVTAGFPSRPKQPPSKSVRPVSSLEQARTHICGSAWFKELKTRADPFDEPYEIDVRLNARHADFVAALSGEEWRRRFPGKALLRHIICLVWQIPAVNAGTRDADLAVTVARWQRENGLPPDLAALHDAIRDQFEAELAEA